MKKLTEFTQRKTDASDSLSAIGREATYRVALDLFTAHPEVLGVMWMFKVPIRDPNEIVELKILPAPGVRIEQDVTMPHILISTKLAHGLGMKCHYMNIPNGDGYELVAIISNAEICVKIPAISTYVEDIFQMLCDLKIALSEAWGESVRTIVYRNGSTLEVDVTEQRARDFHWHDDVGNTIEMEKLDND